MNGRTEHTPVFHNSLWMVITRDEHPVMVVELKENDSLIKTAAIGLDQLLFLLI